MQTSIFTPKTEPPKKRKGAGLARLLAAMTLIGALAATGWWWFFGSKPKLKLKVPVAQSSSGPAQIWQSGASEVALVGGGKLTIVDLKEGAERWSVPLPVAPEFDPEWHQALSKRFLRLQQWSEELSAKRGKLKTEDAIKAFNAEAAKYSAELATARADSARGGPPKAVAKPGAPGKKADYVFGGDRSAVDKLKPTQSEDESIRRARMTKRTEQIEKLKASLANLRPNADTRLKAQQLRDDESKLQMLEQEQKADETALNAPKETDKNSEAEDGVVSAAGATPQKFAAFGAFYWVSEGTRVVSFDAASGAIKSHLPMPGPVTQMVKGESELFFIATAGRTIRYMLKVAADGTSQGIYVAASEEKALVETSNAARTPNILESRTEFVGGATLGMAEVSLVEKKMEERRAIKPGREQDAENAVQTTTGAGTSEAMAVLKVMEIDKLRMATGGVEQIDASKYKVTVRRPFAPTLPAWTGEFTGRVQFFSVDNLMLITAGTKLVALDAKNAKLWESTLGAPAILGDHQQWESAPSHPCFEDHGRLYFFDRAVLTAFNASNGEVVWRLPSIGIQKVEVTGDGSLFVHSANLPTESLTYLSESTGTNQPVLMRVNPKDGSVQWSVEKFENVWASGKDVYSMRIGRHSSDVEKAVFQPGTPVESRMKIYKLNTRNGKPRWEWFQSRTAESVIPFGKTIAILFQDELQIVHSTAL